MAWSLLWVALRRKGWTCNLLRCLQATPMEGGPHKIERAGPSRVLCLLWWDGSSHLNRSVQALTDAAQQDIECDGVRA